MRPKTSATFIQPCTWTFLRHVNVNVNVNVHTPSCSIKDSLTTLKASSSTDSNDKELQPQQKEEQTKQNQQESSTSTWWSPQNLTKDNPGFEPIPDNDYIKQYQANPQLWPVEFFIIAYRRVSMNDKTTQTQILVRRSANGTSKYGLGTGVPVTRWMLRDNGGGDEESILNKAPRGYQLSQPEITFDANHFPEFPKENPYSWTYTKIDICRDAFVNVETKKEECLLDSELQQYATSIRDELYKVVSSKQQQQQQQQIQNEEQLPSFESSTLAVIKNILENPNSIAAIQGTLRMSGLFAFKATSIFNDKNAARYINFKEPAAHPTKIAQSMRIYTMFPQMPNPLPLPTTSAQELQHEIQTRASSMKQSGRDPHKDKHGRYYTHISTSNVSNTIHGIYLTLDVTDVLPPTKSELNGDENIPPALDLFGSKTIQREWVSLEDLKVLDIDSGGVSRICEEDSKPTFISGFIVRQLVKEGVISLT